MLTEVNNKFGGMTLTCFKDEHGRLQGEYKEWYKNGQLATHRFYRNSKLDGEFKMWNRMGRLEIYCSYANDKKHGECKFYGRKNKLIKHCFYINGQEVLFNKIPYPTTTEDRLYFTLKYNLPLLPVEAVC